jgi:hypothetical protein
LDLSNGKADIRPTTASDVNVFMQALSNSNTNVGSSAANNTGPNSTFQPNNVENAANELTSDANMTMVQTSIQEQLNDLANLQQSQNQTPTPNPAPGPNPNPTPDPNPGPDPDPEPDPVKSGGDFSGYASGFLQTGLDGAGEPRFLVNGTSQVTLDPESDSVTAGISVTRIDGLILPKTTTFNLGFTGLGPDAYVDDNDFLALGNDGSTSVERSEWFTRWVQTGKFPWQGKFVTENHVTNYTNVPHTGSFASLPDAPLCQKCDFLKYGFWASDVTYGNNQIDKMGGWWVASSERVMDKDDLPLEGEASYSGTAVGTLATRADNGWIQGAGTGALAMTWNFGQRRGDLDITDFGNPAQGYKSFGGPMFAPGYTEFSGVLAGDGGIGAARGTFVGANGGNPPNGVMGDFGITGSNWRANGIFGGGLVPNQVAGQ